MTIPSFGPRGYGLPRLCAVLGLLWGLGCSSSDKSPQKKADEAKPAVKAPAKSKPAPAVPEPPADETPKEEVPPKEPEDMDSGAWTPGPGIDGCRAQGKAWVAVKAETGAGACGDPEANFCCSEAEIQSRFTNVTGLADNLTKVKTQGLTLYACSTDGVKTTFHFVGVKNANVVYNFLSASRKSEAGAPPASCPRQTLAGLGLEELASGGSAGTETSTATRTSTATGTGTGSVP